MAQKYGLTEKGFNRKRFPFIVEDEKKSLRTNWRADLNLSDRSPLTHLINADATEKHDIHQFMELVYYAFYLQYAKDDALDNGVLFRGLSRFPDMRSLGQVTLAPVAQGVTIPAGYIFVHQSGLIARTTTDAVGTFSGTADAFAESLVTGSLTNFASNSTWTIGPNSLGIEEVTNKSLASISHLGAELSEYVAIPANGSANYYQTAARSFFGHPLRLNNFEFKVQNQTGDKEAFTLRLVLLNDDTGEILKKSGLKTVILEDDQLATVTFEGVAADITSATTIRIALVNEKNSGGTIHVALDATNNYAGGSWYQNGVVQTGKDMVLTVTSEIDGDFIGGRDIETNVELFFRYLKALHLGGSGREAALISELFTEPGIWDVQFIKNTDPANWQQWILNPELDNPSNRPPGSLELIVWGGIEQNIFDKIGIGKGSGAAFVGDTQGFYTDEHTQIHPIAISRPVYQELWADVTLVRNSYFRPQLEEKIKDEIVNYIGGVLSNNISARGRGVAKLVSHSQCESHILKIRGVESVTVELSDDGETYAHADYETPDRTVPFTRLTNITVQ